MLQIVGIADMKISGQPGDQLITYALGSCLGISIYDPVAQVGGLLHVMLPRSTIDDANASDHALRFVDTGVPRLFLECYKAGAQKQRLIVKVAGGASTQRDEAQDCFQIGKRNMTMLKKLLWKNNVILQAHDVGGHHPRTMMLDIQGGTVTIKSHGHENIL